MHSHFLRRREGVQLSYEIPQRINSCCTYPRQASNGSSVVIIGHETGLTIVWYGGRKFRQQTKPTTLNSSAVDLTADDEIDQPSTTEYEDEQEEIDASRPFQDVLIHHEISFGTGAAHVAVPPLPTERTIAGFPSLCETHIVVAAACTDQTLRIVTIPLQPVKALVDVQIVKLGTASMHQELVADIAITLTANNSGDADAEKRARSRSRGRGAGLEQEQDASSRNWSVLVASASPTGNGLLLIHQLPLENGIITTDPECHVPAHRRFIRSPLTNCRIAFNPSPFPVERHSHLLVTIPDASSVQVYDILPQQDLVKRRHEPVDCVSSAARQYPSVGARTLITLLPGFSVSQVEDELVHRKRVLDAQWILQGRAIITLLDDGEWGIWDLEAVAPTTASKFDNLVRGQTNVSGIRGGALTRFTLSGHVGSNALTAKRKSSSQRRASLDAALAPMTPHTRKERSSGLFKPQENDPTPPPAVEQSRGSINVSKQNLVAGGVSKGYDESVILTYNAENTFIPAIQAYWRSQDGVKSSFDTLGGIRPVALPTLYPAGLEQIATQHLPGIKGNLTGSSTTPAFISVTSSRLTLLVPPLVDAPSTELSSSLPMRLMATKSGRQDQALLESGELDVDGMDRILDTMVHGSTENSTVLNGLDKKGISFQTADNDDVDMSTPTIGKSSHSTLIVDKTGSEKRRLFT